MKSINLILLLFVLFLSSVVMAQIDVSGTITDSSGETLPGVNIYVDGTQAGTVSNIEGKYTLSVPNKETVIVYSFTGMETEKRTVGDQMVINLVMREGVDLNEAVVTALGISKAKKALGYSAQELSGETTENSREGNILAGLTGKVAGVQVTSSTALGGSSRVLLRGAGSVAGNNSPLYVINGVPIDDTQFQSANQERSTGGYDYGSPINDINPDDIESMTILKGPTAAALYGSRAANGAIIITTKKGGSGANNGVGVEVNSGISFQSVYVLPDYQNEYGGGPSTNWADTIDGAFIPVYNYDGSWGPKFEGQTYRPWYSWDATDTENFGQTATWEASPDNIKDFFQTGVTTTNSFALSGGDQNQNVRFSYTNLNAKGTQVNSTLKRNNIGINASNKFSDKLSANVSGNYVQSIASGRPQTGYGESVMSQFTQWYQRQLDTDMLRDLYESADGSMRTWNRMSPTDASVNYWDNPFWERYKNVQNDQRDRLTGVASLSYKINDKLGITGRAMLDTYSDRREERIAVGGVRQAAYSENLRTVSDNNFDLILNYTNQINENINLTGIVGGNTRVSQVTQNLASTQDGLNTPGLYNLSNSIGSIDVDDIYRKKKVNSLFASATVGYKSFLYVDLTARNDWSSTLPEEERSYFYPSATASFVFSELVDLKVLSFGKIRAGWSQVGNDTDPYNTENVYVNSQPFNNSGSSTVGNELLNANLRPEKISSFEIGTDLRFFVDRVRVDLTYYNSVTEDLLFGVAQSSATGYSRRFTNAGKVKNTGIEITLGGTPVKRKDFRWDVDVNYAKNNNEVLELIDGVDALTLTSLFGVTLEARVGESYGTFMGTGYQTDASGNRLVDASGFYMATDERVALGTYLPDFTGGIGNTFTFKNLSLYALIDFQKGGSLHSYSNQWGKYSGTLEETAEGGIRENGIVVEGVYAPGVIIDDVDVSGQENTTNIDAQSHFFSNQGYVINEADQYDASFVKFREARLSYSLPPLFNNRVADVEIGIYARNIAILTKNAPHIDPEVTVSNGNIQGFEGGQLPAQRTIGFNLRFKI